MIRFFRRLKAIISMMRDPDAGIGGKLLVAFGLLYLFLPVELVPDFLLPAGVLDDLVLWISIISILGQKLDRYVVDRKRTRKYRGRTIIEGEAEVRDDDDGE